MLLALGVLWFVTDTVWCLAAPLTGTEGTVTKGAVNFAQICANLANAVDLHPLLLQANLLNFA